MDRKVFEAQMRRAADELRAHQAMFTALGDENRQKILIALLEHYGGLRVNEISALINLSRPATSHHLRTLREAGLVDMYERGTMNFYYASSGTAEWAGLAQLARDVFGLAEEAARRSEAEVEAARRLT